MKEQAKLILDNNSHKCSITIEGKQHKITIASLNELSMPAAHLIIQHINDILAANYTALQIRSLLRIATNHPNISKYSRHALEVVNKLFYREEMHSKNDVQTKELVILNIGCTSTGKSLGNITSIIPKKHQNDFLSLTSFKESTNFSIDYNVNDKTFDIGTDEFVIEIQLKEDQQLADDIKELIFEALDEILSYIKQAVKKKDPLEDIWAKALESGSARLKINKNKTFDVSTSVTFENPERLLETILIKSIRSFSGNSSSYNKLSDDIFVQKIIKDFSKDNLDMTIENLIFFINDTTEFDSLNTEVFEQLKKILTRFKIEYPEHIEKNHSISLRNKFDKNTNKNLISHLFGNKKQRSHEEYYSIDILISSAKLFFKNNNINNGEKLTLVDSLGINQGQIAPGKEKEIAYNRITEAIQRCKPDVIVYNTRIDTKDDYLIEVIKALEGEGYKNRIHIIYGRIDSILRSYCDEEGFDIEEINSEQFREFEEYVSSAYLNKDLISIGDINKNRIYLCDKTGKLYDKTGKPNHITAMEKYMPSQILDVIIKDFHNTQEKTINELVDKKVAEIMTILDNQLVFHKVYEDFSTSINALVPEEYNLLRWNTLEFGIRQLYYGNHGYSTLYPAFSLRRCFANNLNIEELKNILGQGYDDFLREFLSSLTNTIHSLIITAYRLEYLHLLNLRFSPSSRRMHSLTLTDERKMFLRNIFHTCLKKESISGADSLRILTKAELQNLSY